MDTVINIVLLCQLSGQLHLKRFHTPALMRGPCPISGRHPALISIIFDMDTI